MTLHRSFTTVLVFTAALLGGFTDQGHAQTADAAGDGPPPWPILKASQNTAPLPGTAALTMDGDLASQMVAGIDAFLLKQIAESVEKRTQFWKRDFSSPEAYAESIEPNRQSLREMLGMRDELVSGPLTAETQSPSFETLLDDEAVNYRVRSVRWQTLEGVTAIGLLLEPRDGLPIADIVAIPDADQLPEDVADVAFIKSASSLIRDESGFGETSFFARELARAKCRVLVPLLISRAENDYKMTRREWLHRPAYELGRTLAGYELQKVLAGIDALQGTSGDGRPLGVIGWGEGGRLALYAGALDDRIEATCVAGYFGSRQNVWNEPADRTVFGLLDEFGDAEIASLIAPRALTIEAGPAPRFVFRPDAEGNPEVLEARSSKNGKPGALTQPTIKDTSTEVQRARELLQGLTPAAKIQLVENDTEIGISGTTLEAFVSQLNDYSSTALKLPDDEQALRVEVLSQRELRPANQLAEIQRFNQDLLQTAYQERIEYMKDLKTDSLETFEATVEAYREKFRRDVVGEFDAERLPLNARSRPYQEGPTTISYEVLLDTFPGVYAYGVLTLPKDLKLDGSEKRPVVVCQHGLEGRPQDVISESKFNAYSAFATRLAERGFITFAPQNPYIFQDRFRTLQFKAAAIGCTLFSVIVPQHQQITDWLQEQPFVAGDRIGFYGLSYGGKSAMRIPPLVSDYCLSICSADFNEWVWKNAATDKRSLRYSYANKGEYEIFEYNLGGTFNYAEMASLICPRPFMVERGHFDGVGPDDRVAQEFAKIRFLYQAKLGIGDRTEIEWFPGPHMINGVGSYDFLHRHLNWPLPAKQ